MNKQPISINFSQGLDTKTDPWQVPIGKFEVLQNSIFQKGGLLQKRNGYGSLTSLTSNNSYLTTLNDNLVSIGNNVSAYSSSLQEWITKGTLQPCSLNTLPLIRNNLNQTQCDSVVANGMVLTAYTETNSTNSGIVTQYQYAIADVVTGQNIVEPSSIPVISGGTISGSSRVFVVGNYFVIVSQVLISSTTFLQYVSIPILNPVNFTTNIANVSAAQNVFAETYVPTFANPGWDGVVANSTLVIAYNTTAGGQGVHVTILLSSQIATNQASSVVHSFTNSAYIAGTLSICVDLTANPNIFYISFWNPSTSNGYTAAVFVGFGTITTQFTPQQIITSTTISNITSTAQNAVCFVFSEERNAYGYDSAILTNLINAITVSQAGSVGGQFTMARSIGLASKAFIFNSVMYFLGTYQSPFQNTYFLINASTSVEAKPIIVAKLAYENGGGYADLGLSSVIITNGSAQVSYLYKDLIESMSTLNNPQQTTTGGIYSQTGINLVSFQIGSKNIDSSDIAQNLHISGGYLGMFDGYLPVEHNFFLWPDSVEVTYTEDSTITPTGTTTSGSNIITSVSSISGVFPGMTITGTAIPSGSIIDFVGTTTITISQAATGNHSNEILTIQGNIAAVPNGAAGAGSGLYYYQALYEWTDNNGLSYYSAPSVPITYTTAGSGATGSVLINIPTLRLTAKTANPVKIVIYRWSVATGVYNQITSITAPLLNDLTVDYVSFIDVFSDTDITGNNIIYTTGGIVEDINAPSSDIMTLFDTRLWLVDAEDQNLLWVSKQVIEATPVEMSDLFTIYVAPNIGTTRSTGSITALAPMDDKICIFKKNAIYYINGVGPNNLGTTSTGCSLGNYSQPTFITSVVGCANQQSIVLTASGLMFQSDKGIWLLGRDLSTTYIGSPVEDFNDSVITSANVIPDTNYVLFTLNTGEMLMYDYYYQQWGTFVGASAISSCIYNGLHTILNQYGQIMQETPGQYLDGSNPVLMAFITSWLNFAGVQGFERFYYFYLLGMYLSPHLIEAGLAYNYNPSLKTSITINPNNFSSAIASPFADQPSPFGSPVNLEQWLIHAQKQKCQSFQISIQEVFNPEFDTVAGPGFTLSGLNIIAGIKRGSRPIAQNTTAG